MHIYKKNLKAISLRDPNLFSLLRDAVDDGSFEVFMGRDPINLNFIKKVGLTPLFLGSPSEETMKKFQEFLPYSYYPYLYFYGLGNGVFYKMILENQYLERVVIIEPEIQILFLVMNLLDFSLEIASGRVVFLLSSDCSFDSIHSLFISDRKCRLYFKTYDLFIFNDFYEGYGEDISRVSKHFVSAIEHSVISVGNDARDSLIGMKHHIQNIPDMLTSPTLVNLAKVLKNSHTAIIISTGPSLSKQLSLLKKISRYATLFCVDASFPILYKAGIKPDIVFSLERVEATAAFYDCVPYDGQEGVIFALTSIVHPRVKNSIKGGIKQFSMRPFGYTKAFGFHDYGYLGIGMSAANMAYEMVVHAGFKRCILIGQDLAFGEDGSSHAKGAVYGSNEVKSNKQEVFLEKYGGGDRVPSTLIWKLFLNFFEIDIANTRDRIEVINSTEGGVRIRGSIEMSFAEAIRRIDRSSLKTKVDLEFPSKAVSKENILFAYKKCEVMLEYACRKKSHIEDVFLQTASLIEKIELMQKQGELEKLDFSLVEKMLHKIDEVKKLFYEKDFSDYFVDSIQSYIFHQELDIAAILVEYVSNEEERKAKQLKLLYAHRYWLFTLAGGIDCVMHAIKEGLTQASEIYGS